MSSLTETKRQPTEIGADNALPSKRQKTDEQDKFQEGEVAPDSDMMFAICSLRKLASIAPSDCMAILRHMSISPFKPANDPLGGLKGAVLRCQCYTYSEELQMLLSAMNVAVQYREAARQKVANLDDFIKERKSENAVDVGVKVMAMANAITPRCMLGAQLLPLMGLNQEALEKATSSQLACLANLIVASSDKGSHIRAGVPLRFASTIDFVVERLIPGMERALCDFVYKEFDALPRALVGLIKIEEVSKKVGEKLDEEKVPHYGLIVPNVSCTKRDKEVSVFMPESALLDDNYKTLKPDCGDHTVLSLFDGQVRIDLARHRQVKDKYPFKPCHIEALKQYEEYWKIDKLSGARSASVYPGYPRKPSSDITDQEWESVHPCLAYWATFHIGQGEEICMGEGEGKKINTHSIDFLVPLTDESNESLFGADCELRRRIPKAEQTQWDYDASMEEDESAAEEESEEGSEEAASEED